VTGPAFRLGSPEVQGGFPLAPGAPVQRPGRLVFGQDDPPKESGIRPGSGTPEQNKTARESLIRSGLSDAMAAHLKPPGSRP
jgi:hypothetical protein